MRSGGSLAEERTTSAAQCVVREAMASALLVAVSAAVAMSHDATAVSGRLLPSIGEHAVRCAPVEGIARRRGTCQHPPVDEASATDRLVAVVASTSTRRTGAGDHGGMAAARSVSTRPWSPGMAAAPLLLVQPLRGGRQQQVGAAGQGLHQQGARGRR